MTQEKNREKILKQARISLRKGIQVVPVPQGSKGPNLKNWPDLRLKEDQLPKYFLKGANIGWLTGSPSGDLVDVDLDDQAAVLLAPVFLPKTQRIHGREENPTSHYWYRVTPIIPPAQYKDEGDSLVEIRSQGQQTLVPPSFNPDGYRLGWEAVGDPTVVEAGALQRAVAKVAAGALLLRHYPRKGSRHDFAKALAGMLLRAGWEQEEATQFVGAVAGAAGDEEAHGRVGDVISTAKRIATGGAATGAPTLASIVGDPVTERLRQFLHLSPHARGAVVIAQDCRDWPEPATLSDQLPSVDKFNLEHLPESFRPLIEDVADRTQTPPDYAAAAAVLALAGCVSRRAAIQPKALDNSWQVVPNLWGAIVAPPGFMKSPILKAMTAPLNHIEDFWRVEHTNDLAEFGVAKAEAELQQALWREQYKKALKDGKDPPIRPDDSLTRPDERRLLTTDTTFEKLHEILSQNPAGVFMVRDELTGWLSSLDREGREGERGFFLQSWSGDASYTIDRIGRGSIHVPAVCVSLLGNIQPARLRWYLSDALQGGANDDGLFQRFQIMVWPDAPKNWTLVDRPPNVHAMAVAERVYSRLANLPVDNPIKLRFGPAGQELFFEWLTNLEMKVRRDSGLAPAMVGHLSKYRSLMPSLAALFEMADQIADEHCLGDEVTVDLDHACQAVAFCGYLESHANRVYSCLVSPESRAAVELGRHISNGHFHKTFTTREIYLKGWAGLDSPEKARNALAVLEDAAWVRRAANSPSPGGGRPSETWMVNPKVPSKGKVR